MKGKERAGGQDRGGDTMGRKDPSFTNILTSRLFKTEDCLQGERERELVGIAVSFASIT